DVPRPPMNERSIFSPSIAKRLKYSSAENPRPEIVDGEAHADVEEAPERPVGRRRLVEHERLRDLEHEGGRRQLRRAEDLPDLLDEPRLDRLAGRDVDADRQVVAAGRRVAPRSKLAACRLG